MLKLIDGNRPVTLILIDGIDEVIGEQESTPQKNVFAELLEREIKNFPRWLRFVITSRADLRVLRPLHAATRLHIEEMSVDNCRDLYQYIEHALERADGIQAENTYIQQLTEQCAGNFLYAKIICQILEEQHAATEDVLKGAPGDLAYIYKSYFRRTFPDPFLYDEQYYCAFASLAMTEEPIPKETFRRITGWSERQFNLALKVLNPYFSSGTVGISLYHKSVRDWLFDVDADDYMVDQADGIRFIADGCYASYKENMKEMNSYEMKYLLRYMKQGHDKRQNEILKNEEFALVIMEQAWEKRKKFQYETARCLAETATYIYAFSENGVRLLETLLFLAETTDLMVRLEESITYCKRALQIADNKNTKANQEEELMGDICMRLAYVYFRKQDWQNATNNYDQAIMRYAVCKNDKKRINAQMMKGNALRDAEEIEKAIQCFELIELDAAFPKIKVGEENLYCNVLMNYGWALHAAGRFNEGEQKILEADVLIEQHKTDIPFRDIAQIYYLMAVILFGKAEYELSQTYCEKSLYYVKLTYGEDAVEICSALNQMGANYQRMGDHDRAIQIFQESYRIRKQTYGINNSYTAISLRNYATARMRRGNCEDMETVEADLKKVYEIRKALCRDARGLGRLAQINRDLADYYERAGEYEKALERVAEAEQLYKKAANRCEIGSCYRQRGIILWAKGDKKEAMEDFYRSIEIRKDFYPMNHPYMKELQEWVSRCEK